MLRHVTKLVTAAVALALLLYAGGIYASPKAHAITLACYENHGTDSNADGYSDSDQCSAGRIFPPGNPAPVVGSDPSAACAGRNLSGTLAQQRAALMAEADVNLDGTVNVLDVAWAASTPDYLTSYTSTSDRRAEKDQNADGMVNVLDLEQIANVEWFLQDVPAC